MFDKIKSELEDYYRQLQNTGEEAQKVGWKNSHAQTIRFLQLIKLLPDRDTFFTLNDAGCGLGNLLETLQNIGFSNFEYRGYDLLPEMIEAAEGRTRTPHSFHLVSSLADMQAADYTLAGGIFNLKYSSSEADWFQYILETLQLFDQKSSRGFAFNCLTSYSDPEKMRPELYYSDPLFLFDYCKKHFSRNVALLHDYKEYDFTILVRKD